MSPVRKRGRAVEGTSLENWRGCEPFVSSNLTASARYTTMTSLAARFAFILPLVPASKNYPFTLLWGGMVRGFVGKIDFNKYIDYNIRSHGVRLCPCDATCHDRAGLPQPLLQ